MKLSILIPTIAERKQMLYSLLESLEKQIEDWAGNEIEIVVCNTEGVSIGKKRNVLLSAAKGDYVAFIDDDDQVSFSYIDLLMEGISKNVDCCSLTGIITVDGKRPKKFIHYLSCETYHETAEAYHRYPNHLNCIRSSIAKQFKFQDVNWGEDTDWATQVKKSGLLKTEHTIKEVIYFYLKTTK